MLRTMKSYILFATWLIASLAAACAKEMVNLANRDAGDSEPAEDAPASADGSNAVDSAVGPAEGADATTMDAAEGSEAADAEDAVDSADTTVVDRAPPVDAGADGGPLSFASDIYPILADRCIACHTPGGTGVLQGHLDFTTNLASGAFSQLMMKAMGNVPGGAATTCAASGLTRVTPGVAVTSLLFNKVNSKLMGSPALCGDPMPNPAAAAAITSEQVALIETWINQSAKP